MTAFRETDLYPPVRDLLTGLGFTVRGEVRGCDLVAVRGDEVVAVELKRSFNATLLVQACARQRTCDSVYVAIPRPAQQRGRDWKGVQHLLRRLELGLLLVALDTKVPRCEIAFHPVPYQSKRATAERRALLTEHAGRSGDHTPGGSVRAALVTAYREQALLIAWLLQNGPTSPKDLRARGACAKSGAILRDNHYRWFERLGVGRYGITAEGRIALAEYTAVVAGFGPSPRSGV